MAEEVTSFELLLTRGRAVGVCFVFIEQMLSAICRAARISAHLLITFCTTGTELRTTAELLGLRGPEQIRELQTLGKGECIVVLTGDRCPVPVRVKVPPLTIDRSNLSRDEREFYTNRSLKDLLPDVKPRFPGYVQDRQEVKQRERDPNRLSRNAWRDFTRIAGSPAETIEERCAELRMNRAEEEAARRECRNKGYIRQAGTLGRGVRFFELTEKGRAFADQHNVPVSKFKSGVVHEALLQRVKAGLGQACPGLRWVSPAGATGSLQPDAYGLFTSGEAICVEINCKNKPGYEVDKLMALCAIDHVDMVLLVAPTKKEVASLAALVSRKWRPHVPQCYVLLSATECLAAHFDWTTVFERQT